MRVHDLLDVLKIFMLPLITLGLGLIGAIIVDPKEKKRRWLKWIIPSLLLTAFIITIIANYGDEQTKNLNSENQASQIKMLRKDNERLIDDNTILKDRTAKITERLWRQGFTRSVVPRNATGTEILEQFYADKAWQECVVKRALVANQGGVRNVRIEYFQKDVDAPEFFSALQEAGMMGFEPEFTPSRSPTKKTNSLWAGESVSVEDVKLIALTLLRAGLKLKFVGYFCDRFDRRKESLIQIGAEPRFNGKGLLTTSGIKGIVKLESCPVC